MPLLAAGLVAAAAGTAMEMYANKEDQNAINAAESSTFDTLSKDQQKATALWQQNESQQGADTANREISSGAAARNSLANQLIQATQPSTGTPLPATGGTNKAIAGATARANTAGNAWSNTVNRAQSQEGGYSDWQTALGVGNANTNEGIGVINTMARGTANLLPLEVQAASHKGDSLGAWGSIVSALGSAAMFGGATSGAAAAPDTISAGQSGAIMNEAAGVGEPGMTGSGFFTP